MQYHADTSLMLSTAGKVEQLYSPVFSAAVQRLDSGSRFFSLDASMKLEILQHLVKNAVATSSFENLLIAMWRSAASHGRRLRRSKEGNLTKEEGGAEGKGETESSRGRSGIAQAEEIQVSRA